MTHAAFERVRLESRGCGERPFSKFLLRLFKFGSDARLLVCAIRRAGVDPSQSTLTNSCAFAVVQFFGTHAHFQARSSALLLEKHHSLHYRQFVAIPLQQLLARSLTEQTDGLLTPHVFAWPKHRENPDRGPCGPFLCGPRGPYNLQCQMKIKSRTARALVDRSGHSNEQRLCKQMFSIGLRFAFIPKRCCSHLGAFGGQFGFPGPFGNHFGVFGIVWTRLGSILDCHRAIWESFWDQKSEEFGSSVSESLSCRF